MHGGFVGETDKEIKINNCFTKDGTIKGSLDVGGMIGASYPQENVTQIDNCYNTSKIIATAGIAGGILGYSNNELMITNCNNNGEINCNGSSNNAGGIVGYGGKKLAIKKCYNTGKINGDGRVFIGGLVGYADQSASIEECYNSGTIFGILDVGGLIGCAHDLKIMNSYNEGIITCGASNGGSCAGGLVGCCGSNYPEIQNSYNKGDITAAGEGVGGIIGEASVTSLTVSNTFNIGTITSTLTSGGANTGGIIGNSTKAELNNCYNMGDILAKSTQVGGISGYTSSNGPICINCYNSGDITAENGYVGGIAGYYYSANMKNCHNAGNIIVNAESSNANQRGEIGGYESYNNPTVEDCTFLTRDNNANNNGATSKSQTEMNEIMSIQNFITLMNSYVTDNNADSTKTKLKTWKVENDMPVFAE